MFSWANPIWPFRSTHIFALLFWDVFLPWVWITLLLLPIPLPSGHAIVISWSPSSSSPSHRACLHVAAWALFSAHSLSFFFEYMCVCVCVCVCVSVYIYKLHHCLIYFLFIFWPHHSSCRTLVPRTGIELTPPAMDLNHWTAREVPFPTHHHPLCFLEAHSQLILENGHLQWNYT